MKDKKVRTNNKADGGIEPHLPQQKGPARQSPQRYLYGLLAPREQLNPIHRLNLLTSDWRNSTCTWPTFDNDGSHMWRDKSKSQVVAQR